jgi:hypothetical protein
MFHVAADRYAVPFNYTFKHYNWINEHRLQVLENWLLRRMFASKKDVNKKLEKITEQGAS